MKVSGDLVGGSVHQDPNMKGHIWIDSVEWWRAENVAFL